MLKINKVTEPDFLLEFKRKNSPRTWDDYSKVDIKSSIKSYILQNEQNDYCPYCEKRIYKSDEGHIEHLKPKDKFPQYFQEYVNLLVSCNEKDNCGMSKRNNYSDDFINPVIENPKEYFTYNLASGEIVPIHKDDNNIKNKRAIYTIALLNLNNYVLKEARKNLIEILEVYRENYDEYDEYLQYFLNDGCNFPSLIKHYMEE
jgi:uncharacterized protein (TIGR02646 family)